MPDIIVEKGKPLTIGTLEVKVDNDEVILTSTHGDNKTIGTFKTQNFALDSVVKIEAKGPFGMRMVAGGSETELTISQEVRDAYNRAIADGKIDENEQKQFQELQQELDAIDIKKAYAGGGLQDKFLLPFERKAQAVAAK